MGVAGSRRAWGFAAILQLDIFTHHRGEGRPYWVCNAQAYRDGGADRLPVGADVERKEGETRSEPHGCRGRQQLEHEVARRR